MAAEVGGHDLGARCGPLALLEQIRRRLVNECLQLAVFLIGQGTHGCQDLSQIPKAWG